MLLIRYVYVAFQLLGVLKIVSFPVYFLSAILSRYRDPYIFGSTRPPISVAREFQHHLPTCSPRTDIATPCQPLQTPFF